MKMKCPHCGVSGEASQAAAGRLTKCPRCTELFLIPDPSAAVQSQTPTPIPTEPELEHLEPVFPDDETVTEERDIFGGPVADDDGELFGETTLESDGDQIELDVPASDFADDGPESLDISIEEEGVDELSDWTAEDDAPLELPGDEPAAADSFAEPTESTPVESTAAEQIMQDIAAEIDADKTSGEQDLTLDPDAIEPLSENVQTVDGSIDQQQGGPDDEVSADPPSESGTFDNDGAEQIMLDISSEIDADETKEGLEIDLDLEESGDADSWTEQFDEGALPEDSEPLAAEDDGAGKEELIGEEFFEFDAPSHEDFLDITDSGTSAQEEGSTDASGPGDAEQSVAFQDYPDFSEDKVTWKQDGGDAGAADDTVGEESIEFEEIQIPQPGEEEIQAELHELLTTSCLACDNKVEGEALYCQECIAKRGLDEDTEQQPADSPDQPSGKAKGGGTSGRRIALLCLLLACLGAAGFVLLQQYGIL